MTSPHQLLTRSLEKNYGSRAAILSHELIKLYNLDKKSCELHKLLQALSCQKPVEYLLGEISFLNTRLKVDSRALIPRVETELLAEKLIQKLKKCSKKGETLVDVGTGSGCLAIALKKNLPHLKVLGIDLSLDALQLARENARNNKVEVIFYQGDMLSDYGNQPLDYLLSNPPYISEEEMLELGPSVRDFEPPLALFGGKEGMDLYKRLYKEFKVRMPRALFLEIGAMQGDKVKELFDNQGEIVKDYSGKDRFFFLERE